MWCWGRHWARPLSACVFDLYLGTNDKSVWNAELVMRHFIPFWEAAEPPQTNPTPKHNHHQRPKMQRWWQYSQQWTCHLYNLLQVETTPALSMPVCVWSWRWNPSLSSKLLDNCRLQGFQGWLIFSEDDEVFWECISKHWHNAQVFKH